MQDWDSLSASNCTKKKDIPCKNLGCQHPIRETMKIMPQTNVSVHSLVLFSWQF